MHGPPSTVHPLGGVFGSSVDPRLAIPKPTAAPTSHEMVRLIPCLAFLLAPASPLAVGLAKKWIGRVAAGPLEISSLGCGTWSWGNKLLWDYSPEQDDEIYEAYVAVRDGGVTVFDTADSYGTFELNGRAEMLLGQFERRYQEERESAGGGGPFDLVGSIIGGSMGEGGNAQQVATKLAPYPWRITRGSLVSAARSSLDRLDQDKIAIAQLHWSTQNYQPFQERALWEGIADVYDEGLCEAVGVSNYGPVQLGRFAERMRERDVPLAIAQVQYSLLTAKNDEIIQACDEAGCRLVSYSPLCLGLLTCKYDLDNLPRQGNPRRQLFKELLPGARPLLDTLKDVARDSNRTPTQVAINWAMCKGTVPNTWVQGPEAGEGEPRCGGLQTELWSGG
ncbi:hypothetical protein THAOC_05732 [Thalassiosira oceanica]|uniref:NADP-dependent oxidoreductase domain-containing protein n=1 Tax=Thalassiosira oceanica TaxID=159749 RepID=K0TMI6_THAOC|nr:hypothetical protein THAOC_05732 [Thalassiosira oceanica]|eukprot:EJK72707.1 hypothetical protein THAOC_05732 [Thalassiosira oceanica]